MRFFLTHLGCKLNQAETESVRRRLLADGHRPADRLEDADVHIVNSCTVTHVAARDSRKVARRAGRAAARGATSSTSDRARIRTVLTGCYATASAAEARRLAGVDLVVTNDRKDQLIELLYQSFPELAASSVTTGPVPVSFPPLAFGKARAALKIEDGCNMRCSFCIIPTTRGRQTSRPAEDVVRDLRELVSLGHREVVVTGVQISSYRSQDLRLADLVTRMLEETEVERLRLTSIAPWQFDRRLLPLLRSERVCRHVHLSLQSGCDDTLRRMRRPYDRARYRALVAEIRDEVPGVAITTDVIVGFPGESDDHFAESFELVRETGFARSHVFPYSSRPGTPAAELRDDVPPEVKKERVTRMIAEADAAARRFAAAQVGSVEPVLWEQASPQGLRGMTDNYVKVAAVPGSWSSPPPAGSITQARVVALSGATGAGVQAVPASNLRT